MSLYKKQSTIGYWLANALLLLAAGLIAFAMNGCASAYELAKARFAHEVADTTFTTITTTVPSESVVTTFVTDTTHYIEKLRQGRATVTIIREPTNTTIIANCDSLSKSQQVATRIENQQWGVDPSNQKWKWIAFGLIGFFALLLVLIACAVVGVRFFSRNYSVTPKNGTASQPS
jgi:uncharacterized protein YpmS